MLYEEFLLVYGAHVIDGNWWRDFENNLGKLDLVDFYERCHTETPDSIWKEYHQHKGSGLPNGVSWHPVGNRLDSLYFVLNAVMRQWIAEISMIFHRSPCLQLPQDAFYITFNYTNVLEYVYQIPKENILHIHGSLENGDKLIFGHGLNSTEMEYQYDDKEIPMPHDEDVQKIAIAFGKEQKNPYEYMAKYHEIFSSLSDVEHIYALGFSFSEVDAPYITSIRGVAPKARWTISYHDEEKRAQFEDAIRTNCLGPVLPIEFFKL